MYQRNQPTPSMLADLLARMPIEAPPHRGREQSVRDFLDAIRGLHARDDREREALPPGPPRTLEGELPPRMEEDVELPVDDGNGLYLSGTRRPAPKGEVLIENREMPPPKTPPGATTGDWTEKDMQDFADALHKRLFGELPMKPEEHDEEGLHLRGTLDERPPKPGEPGSPDTGLPPIVERRTEVRVMVPVKKVPGKNVPEKKPKKAREAK